MRSACWCLSTSFVFCLAGHCAPISQKTACEQFSPAVVSIDASSGDIHHYGTGFLVSSDGYILTANHVVRNGGTFMPSVRIGLESGESLDATIVSRLSIENAGKDYALLKVESAHPLPFLLLGTSRDVTIGGDATLIGFPFSAFSHEGTRLLQKFCLTASFASADTETIAFHGTQPTPFGRTPITKDVHVDVIYFQGPSIKGVSGSPLISRDTGRVVGVVSTTLSGIGRTLSETRQQIERNGGRAQMSVGGVDTMKATYDIITVLDSQLVDGLGSATGIDAAKEALRAQQEKH